jgi:hypothetical protein
VPVPIQDLDYQLHMSWYSLCSMIWDESSLFICWYWLPHVWQQDKGDITKMNMVSMVKWLLHSKRHSKTTPNKKLLNLELLQVVYYVQGTCTYGIAQTYSLLMLNFIPSMIIAAQPWHCCSAEAENLGPILWPTCRVSQREFLFLSNPPWHQYEFLSLN